MASAFEDVSDMSESGNTPRLPMVPGISLLMNDILHGPSEHLLLRPISPVSRSSREDDISVDQPTTQEDGSMCQDESSRTRMSCQQNHTRPTSHEGSQNVPERIPEAVRMLSTAERVNTDQEDQRTAPRSLAWRDKLGTFAVIILLVGLLFLLTALGTLGFIWFGNPTIAAWKEIIARNWLSKAVAICMGVIQQVMMLQLGTAVAMVASLTLESRDVVLGDLATVSMMRATAGGPDALVLLWQHLSRGWSCGIRQSKSFVLIILVSAFWALSQFLLLIILIDVSPQSTPGFTSTTTLPYNLHYNKSNTSTAPESQVTLNPKGPWGRKATEYVTFAEYSEPPYTAPGVSDTGVTLRAFLPFNTAQDREMLERYSGNASVLDARVTCQVPQINDSPLLKSGESLAGSVAPSRHTPRLVNTPHLTNASSIWWNGPPIDQNIDSAGFLCNIPTLYEPSASEWMLAVCQLPEGIQPGDNSAGTISGGLASEFRNMTPRDDHAFDPTLYGTAYLVINLTRNGIDFRSDLDTSNISFPPERTQERGEWLDLIYFGGNATLSMSLCYAAFDFADIPVHIVSRSRRDESLMKPVFDTQTSTYTFPGLRRVMGQDHSLTLDQRGVLELEGQTWQAGEQENFGAVGSSSEWYLRAFADLAYPESFGVGTIGNITVALLSPGSISRYPGDGSGIEQIHVWLVQEILRTGGTIAFALQTMITLLSSMTYYDQMDKFDKWTQAEQSFFQSAQAPHGYAGFVIVTSAIIAHCILISFILYLFLRHTSVSRVGGSWSAVAQVATGDVQEYLVSATRASDKSVTERMKFKGVDKSKVRLERGIDEQVLAYVVGERKEKD